MNDMSKGLKLTDILVTFVIAIVFGIVYQLWTPFYEFLGGLGLHIDQLSYGMWFIAATVAYLIIRKPGVALLAELAAASGSLILGSPYGVELLIYGFLQGLFAELVFFAVRYKRYDILVVSLAGAASAAASLLFDWYKGYIGDLEAWNLALMIGFRTISAIVICGVFAYFLVKALEATGVTNLVRPASKEDYDALDK
ncbi:ECF transporter S component [Chengkuizengella axinellae]|uniref:ECF transporter S component n=1 Tax=Chengkuizengella axinellae TaxID=3064388 RepID=A0ABT9J087_9BACL|nr:ECF transporter S component [Chengkuizengella sp. 2205SS18-9]MDP5274985.1 ECF transporter S component [Chengkuizengella sp. 2205SS18-9]